MLPVQFPPPSFKIRQQNDYDEIFDAIRKRWLSLTPEEWVRQNMIAYLIQTINVPPSLISLEKEVAVGELNKRFDIMVYDKRGQPWMLIECKSMDVNLSEKTLSQMLSYFSGIQCRYALITNGTYTYGWKFKGVECAEINEFPTFPQSYP